MAQCPGASEPAAPDRTVDELKKERGVRQEGVADESATSSPVGDTPEALSEVSVVDDAEPMLGQLVGQKYRIERKIGQGGMGEVYLGLNAQLGQQVAIKFLSRKLAHDEGIVARFLNEARSYCRVNHPNAVTLLEYGQHTDGTLYIITEFVEGMNLGETLKQTGPFATQQVIHVGMQIADVLSAAHAQGVIHRDLKPDNVMLMPVARGRYAVKVLDFGIAKIVDDDNDGPTTETGSVFGTPEFMSPEQARGDGADPRSDIYALGIILFFMVTGKLPFRGKNKLAVLNKQLHDVPPSPSEFRKDVSPQLQAVIMKCLSKEPSERYPAAEDLHEALEDISAPVSRQATKITASVDPAPRTPQTKQIRAATLRLGGDEPDEFAETWASVGEKPYGFNELESIDLSRDRTDSPKRSRGSLLPVMGSVFVVLALVAGAGWSMRRGEPVAPSVDVEQVLLTGQVLGLMSAADDMLDSGSLESARRAMDQTVEWAAAGALDARSEETREALFGRLSRMEEKREALLAAARSGDCSAVIAMHAELVQSEPGLARRLRRQVRRCLKPSREMGGQRVEPAAPAARAQEERFEESPSSAGRIEESNVPDAGEGVLPPKTIAE